MTASPPQTGGPWRATGTVAALVVGGLGLALLGLLLGRADVSVLGAPLVLGLVWAALTRPTEPGEVVVEGAHQDPDSARVRASVRLEPPAGSELALLRVGSPSHRTVDVAVAAPRSRTVGVSVSGVRTGRQRFFSVVHRETSVGQVVGTAAIRAGPVTLTVLPRTRPLGHLPLPPRLQGLTGSHDSRRVGDGGDLHDIAPFTPGDRLRRIDWRVTLRESGRGARPGSLTDLHVRRSLATADAVVTLVLDSRDDIGRDISTWSGYAELHPEEATSLDIAREAAASIAKAYLEAGDRVGVVDLGHHHRPLRPAGGRRHLLRVMHTLATATPSGRARPVVRPPQVPSGALLIVFSTFLDDQASGLAATWCRHGHRVLALDVLPPLDRGRATTGERNVYRVVDIERADRLWELERAGVETVAWHELAGDERTLAIGLAARARQRSRPR